MVFLGRKKELLPIEKGSQAKPPALSSKGSRLRPKVVFEAQGLQSKARVLSLGQMLTLAH